LRGEKEHRGDQQIEFGPRVVPTRTSWDERGTERSQKGYLRDQRVDVRRDRSMSI
jgi:hypothetical protein